MATQGASIQNFHVLFFFMTMLITCGAVDCIEYALLGWWTQQCSWWHHAHNRRSGFPHSNHLFLLIPFEQAQKTLCWCVTAFLEPDKSREVNFYVFDEVECLVSCVVLVLVCLILWTSNWPLYIKMLCHLYPVLLIECSNVVDRWQLRCWVMWQCNAILSRFTSP